MKKFLLESVLILGVTTMISSIAVGAERKEITVTGEGGVVNKVFTVGVGVKRGKYTLDVHTGVETDKKALSVGIYREIIKLEDLGIGVGLSANETETINDRLIEKRTYQGYDLNLDYDLGKTKLRGTINSNGDVKFGVGFSF